jgi:hypothetical protein
MFFSVQELKKGEGQFGFYRFTVASLAAVASVMHRL